MDRSAYRRKKKVEVFDPYEQPNLYPMIRCEPALDQLEIQNSYHVEGERVFCHICGGHRHQKGYTGMTGNREAILFGSSCAKNYFPENILKAAERSYKNKLAAVDAEYNVHVIKATSLEIDSWLKTNSNMVLKMDQTWKMLFDEHPEFIKEVFDHLDRNDNRLTQEYVTEASEISKEVGRNQRNSTIKIVAAIGNENGRKQIKYLGDNLRLIKQFSHILAELPTDASSEMIINIDKKLRSNFFNAIEGLHQAMLFSVEFFSPKKLKIVGKWSDEERIIRLRDFPTVTPRNMAQILINKIEDGFQMPATSLREVIATESFLLEAIAAEHENDSSKSNQRTQ